MGYLHNDREAFRTRLILRGYTPARVQAILSWAYLFGGQ